MVIRSDIITESDIRHALAETRSEDCEDIYLDEDGIQAFKPRRKAYGFKFYCESCGGRRARNGRPGHAASWDAYGLLFARLFKVDPNAYIAWYDGIEQFIEATNRYQPRGAQAPWLADEDLYTALHNRARLEYLRGELRAERISYGELVELQGLAEHIPAGDVELREAAGLPEHA
jgi:hypothetical protein